MRNAIRDILAFLATNARDFSFSQFASSVRYRRCRSASSYIGSAGSAPRPYFFLPAIGLAGPLRVRALVWVR